MHMRGVLDPKNSEFLLSVKNYKSRRFSRKGLSSFEKRYTILT